MRKYEDLNEFDKFPILPTKTVRDIMQNEVTVQGKSKEAV